MPGFDAGSIEARATLDRSDFVRELAQLRADGANAERNPIRIRAELDAAQVRAQIDELNQRLRGANNNIRVGVEINGSAAALAQLQALEERINRLSGRTVSIRVEVNGGAAAISQLTAVNTLANRVNGQRATVHTSASGTAQTSGALNSVANSVRNTKLGMVDLIAVGLALGPALIPIAGGALGVAGGLISMAAAGGGAAAIFGGVLTMAMKNADGAGQAYANAQGKVAAAEKAVNNTKAGTQARTVALQKLAQAQQQLTLTSRAYGPVARQYEAAMASMRNAEQTLVADTSSFTLKPVTTAVQAVASAIPKLAPIVRAVSPVVQQIANDFKGWVNGQGVDRAVQFIQSQGIPILERGRVIIEALAKTAGNLIRAFAPVGQAISKSLAAGAVSLQQWSNNGFTNFVRWLSSNAGSIKAFFVALLQAIVNLGKALAMAGPGALTLTTTLLHLIASLPPSMINALVQGFIALRIAILAAALASKIFALSNPIIAMIVLITTAIVLLAMHWKQVWEGIKIAALTVWAALVTAWNNTWNFIKGVATAVWGWLQQYWKLLILVIGPIGWLIALAASWSSIWNGIKGVAAAIWGWLQTAWNNTLNFVRNVTSQVLSWLQNFFNQIWNNIRSNLQSIWNGLQQAWNNFLNFIRNLAQQVFQWLQSFFQQTMNNIASTARTVWTGIQGFFTGAWNTLKTLWNGLWSAMSKTFTDTMNGIKTTATTIWNGIKTAFRDPINVVIGFWNNGIARIGNDILSAFGISGKTIPTIPTLARGGPVRGPGGPTDDKVPALLSNGEHVLTAAEVNALGGQQGVMKFRRNLMGRNVSAGGTNRLAGGGSPANPGGTGTTNPNTGGSAGSSGNGTNVIGSPAFQAAWNADPGSSLINNILAIGRKLIGGAVAAALQPIINTAKSGINGSIGRVGDLGYDMAQGLDHRLDQFMDWVRGQDKKATAIGGQIPAGQHLAIIDAALKAAGVPPPGTQAEWEAGLNTLITRESAWNAGAINLTDSNAQAGHPSQGLAQTIPSTFNAYHVAGTSGSITDPVANVAAAIRYIVATYGNISNVQQANANLPPKGYAMGGVIREPVVGLGMATGRTYTFAEKGPETVFPTGSHPGSSMPERLVIQIGEHEFEVVMGDIIDRQGATATVAARYKRR